MSVHVTAPSHAQEQFLAPEKTRTLRIILSTIAWSLVALAAASVIIFFSLHILPGDPATLMGGFDATPEQVDLIRHQYGWDRPVIVQYVQWLGGALGGDLGVSPYSKNSVTSELVQKMQVTLPLAIFSLLLALAFALIVGVYAAVRSHTKMGHLISWLSQLGIAVPSFVVGMLLIMYVAAPFGLPFTGFPRAGWEAPQEAFRSLILPTITLAIPQGAMLTRFVRSAMLEQLNQDYVRTARAQGMGYMRTILTQALRNAWLPLLSVIALDAASLIMGTVVVEQVFALPGIGQHLVASVTKRDIVMVQGFLMVLSSLVILIMLLSNLASRLLDPRIRVAT
ncbi:ABC transporter permease [Actinotignum urinale]|uniref:ABC transporter permease n=1 Tax=Actinotignum urinale TaxID=190146 RepID=A0AAW9HMA4_9ACTO|nr:ABC transporter permease [Actinotignum urinale]MDY5129212.1 ABC transporter permease [Actinotignum urinale]MDY5132400.1 ABC transporter permease [Actinotignum urinale]MDY5151507.1 ABC transporter permease [Actinotignum urinale]MDY5155030.1 ABC transporter permease [Actinotignum urinale]WIK59274.1 ABC transporter permease [Actinotignum urinale]